MSATPENSPVFSIDSPVVAGWVAKNKKKFPELNWEAQLRDALNEYFMIPIQQANPMDKPAWAGSKGWMLSFNSYPETLPSLTAEQALVILQVHRKRVINENREGLFQSLFDKETEEILNNLGADLSYKKLTSKIITESSGPYYSDYFAPSGTSFDDDSVSLKLLILLSV